MAQKQAGPALVIVVLLLFSAATPTAYGQRGLLAGLGNIGGAGGSILPLGPVVGGGILDVLIINGKLCCSSTGNCNATTPPLPGVNINVICTNLTGASVVVGQGITGANGAFSIRIRNILTQIGNILSSLLNGGKLPCVVVVDFPLKQLGCPALNPATTVIAGLPEILSSLLASVVYATVRLFLSLTIVV